MLWNVLFKFILPEKILIFQNGIFHLLPKRTDCNIKRVAPLEERETIWHGRSGILLQYQMKPYIFKTMHGNLTMWCPLKSMPALTLYEVTRSPRWNYTPVLHGWFSSITDRVWSKAHKANKNVCSQFGQVQIRYFYCKERNKREINY